MEKIQFTHIINNETVAFTLTYNVNAKYIDNISCKVGTVEYNTGTVWHVPVKVKSAEQLRKLFQNYKPSVRFDGDKMDMNWYIDILEDDVVITLFCESARADNLAQPSLVNDAKDEATWLAEELEALTLNDAGEKKKPVVEDIPIYTETSKYVKDPRDERINELTATIKKQQAEIERITANSLEYANSTYVCINKVHKYVEEIDALKEKVAKQYAAIAKYKDQITRQCARIYVLKKDLDRAADPYAWN